MADEEIVEQEEETTEEHPEEEEEETEDDTFKAPATLEEATDRLRKAEAAIVKNKRQPKLKPTITKEPKGEEMPDGPRRQRSARSSATTPMSMVSRRSRLMPSSVTAEASHLTKRRSTARKSRQ